MVDFDSARRTGPAIRSSGACRRVKLCTSEIAEQEKQERSSLFSSPKKETALRTVVLSAIAIMWAV